MGTDLQVAHASPLALISSPDLKRLRRISLGTVQWPGMAPRRYLSGGSTLTDSERSRARELLAELEQATKSTSAADAQRFGLIAKMLLAYPVPGASAQTGEARGEAYREALNDIPPATLAEAIKRWHRGEAGDHDYRWAPAPAVLRDVCLRISAPLLDAANDLRVLLGAVSMERAMDPTPLPIIEGKPETVVTLRRMG